MWGEIGGWLVVLLALGGASMHLRHSLLALTQEIRQEWERLHAETEQDRAQWALWRQKADHDLADIKMRVEQARALLEKERKETDELFVGSFLTDDQHAAEFERQIKRSEDHAIASAGPVRFSSTPSRGSGSKSVREPSTQRPRGSGRP